MAGTDEVEQFRQLDDAVGRDGSGHEGTLRRGPSDEPAASEQLILADELQEFPDEERRDVTRALFDQLLWPAIAIAGDVHAANPLLRSFTAVVDDFAYLPRGGFTRGFPTDMRGFSTEGDLVADEAARGPDAEDMSVIEPQPDGVRTDD